MAQLNSYGTTRARIVTVTTIAFVFIYASYTTKYTAAPSTTRNLQQQQQQQQQQKQQTSKIRYAVVHVGPPKTASTTIQSAITRDTNVFQSEKYFVKGPFEELVNCMKMDDRSISKCPPDMRNTVFNEMMDATTNYDNLFISSEGFGDEGSDLNELASMLEPYDDVTILMGYRRLFEWLPSKYHQYHRKYTHYWNWLGREPFPSLKEFLTKEKIMSYIGARYLPSLKEFYGQKFSNIKIINLHNLEMGDVVPEVYCNMIPNAPQACQVAKQRTMKREKKGIKMLHNPSLEEIHYIRLVRVAAQIGLLEDHVEIKEAVEAARYKQENLLGMRVSDFPQECMDLDILTLMLELSIEMEKTLVPEWFNRSGGEDDIKNAFHEAATTKLCTPNVQAILMDENWQKFFMSLNEANIMS